MVGATEGWHRSLEQRTFMWKQQLVFGGLDPAIQRDSGGGSCCLDGRVEARP
jgi:hypothetical protein